MIHLEQGQKVYGHDEYVVLEATGDYNNEDLILCAHKDTPTEPYSKFEAQFAAYGGMVYKITDEVELLKEIQDIDPATLIDIPSIDEVQAVDPFNQMIGDTVTPPATTPVMDTTPTVPTATGTEPYFAPVPPEVPVVSTTTPGTDLLNSSTTPAVDTGLFTSTTTPTIDIPPIVEIITPTSTPVIDIVTPSSTPVIDIPVVVDPLTATSTP